MTQSTIDFIGGFFHVVATRISDKTRSVLLDLAGVADPLEPDNSSSGEIAKSQLAYGPLGLISNPLDPGTLPDGRTPAWADNFALRTADGVLPVVWFDPRIDLAFPDGPKKGTIALAGYAGGFHAIDIGDSGTNIHVLYAPFSFPPNVETAAHAIILDPTDGNKSVSIIHGFGHSILLTPDGHVVIRSPNGAVSIQLGNDGITLFGNTVIAGGATIGSPTGALPAAKATPLIAYLTALEALLATIAAATVPSTAPAVTTFVGAQAATKAAIAAVNTSVF